MIFIARVGLGQLMAAFVHVMSENHSNVGKGSAVRFR